MARKYGLVTPLMERLEPLAREVDRLAHATGDWLVAETSHMNLSLSELAPPGVVIGCAAIVLVAVVVCICAVVRIVSVVVASRRARSNALIVQLAEFAPEDDGDEHECEQHNASRSAAPGDSDYEEDPLAGVRKNDK